MRGWSSKGVGWTKKKLMATRNIFKTCAKCGRFLLDLRLFLQCKQTQKTHKNCALALNQVLQRAHIRSCTSGIEVEYGNEAAWVSYPRNEVELRVWTPNAFASTQGNVVIQIKYRCSPGQTASSCRGRLVAEFFCVLLWSVVYLQLGSYYAYFQALWVASYLDS